MHRVVRVEARPGYRLYVEFGDGVRGQVDLRQRLFGPMFEPLKDVDLFGKVAVDEFGAVCWPNGADLAPDALHARLQAACAPADAVRDDARG
jgi:hypothetical protein